MPRSSIASFISFNHPATTEIYTLSLHDALPIFDGHDADRLPLGNRQGDVHGVLLVVELHVEADHACIGRSEEHTSELQSRLHLVCRLLLEKKKHQNKKFKSIDTLQVNIISVTCR